MKERPILFSAPMVRALLDGSKTQTRRAVKITHRTPGLAACLLPPVGAPRPFVAAELCPHGKPGDRLWVREAWRVIDVADCFAPREITAAHRLWFGADGPHEPPAGRYRPGMFMPRWASRITLEITTVRVERLRDISEADALAEGIAQLRDDGFGLPDGRHYHAVDARQSYFSLWDSINGPGSVEANPWVWVIEAKRIAQ